MDWNEWDLEATILSITTPSVPRWVVFTSEEESGPDDIWTEPVILWALVEKCLNEDEAETNRFLEKEVPSPRRKVVAMICDEGGPTLADDTEFLYVGYSATEKIDRKDWEDQARRSRKKWARLCGVEASSEKRAT